MKKHIKFILLIGMIFLYSSTTIPTDNSLDNYGKLPTIPSLATTLEFFGEYSKTIIGIVATTVLVNYSVKYIEKYLYSTQKDSSGVPAKIGNHSDIVAKIPGVYVTPPSQIKHDKKVPSAKEISPIITMLYPWFRPEYITDQEQIKVREQRVSYFSQQIQYKPVSQNSTSTSPRS